MKSKKDKQYYEEVRFYFVHIYVTDSPLFN